MKILVGKGEQITVSEPALDQGDPDRARMSLTDTGNALVAVRNKFKKSQKEALITVQNDGRVYVVVFNENGTTRRSYDLDAIEGIITNRWEAK